MDFGASAIYEDGTDPLYEKIRLMSSCKHFIISNSTFSWWGAWLNSNPSKIVIGPKYWFNPECKLASVNHIIPKKWIKM